MSLPVKTHTQFCLQAGKQYQVNCPTCSTVEKVLDAARKAVAKEAKHGPLYSVRNSGDAQRGWDAMSRHALAAIDTLREEQS